MWEIISQFGPVQSGIENETANGSPTVWLKPATVISMISYFLTVHNSGPLLVYTINELKS